jgi:hypothetical protein
LLHEICHHLDFTLFELTATFHTTGFFRRESSLMRQLAGRKERKARAAAPAPTPEAEQLELFGSKTAPPARTR